MIMTTLSITQLEILSVIGVVAGFLLAVSGTGGMMMLPALLLTGMNPLVALGTNKLYTSVSLFSAAIHFIRKGFFKPIYWVATIVASSIGALLGVVLVQIIEIGILEKALPIVIALIALYMLFPKKTVSIEAQHRIAKPNSVKHWILAIILGIYSGFLGAGTMALWLTMLVGLFRMEMIKATALAGFMCFISNATALVVFIVLNEVDFFVGIDLAICGALGAYIGARMAIQWGALFIRILIIVVTFAMSINLALGSWFNNSFVELFEYMLLWEF